MRDLERLQRWMQMVIMHPDGVEAGVAAPEARQLLDVKPEEAERVVTRSRSQVALDRLAIYHHAYFARLVECLREEFPVLLHALGDKAFDSFAIAYLQKYPSRSYTLNQLGACFPRYLEESRPPAKDSELDWPDFLIDLARLEWTYAEVFDGPGIEGQPPLETAGLLELPEDHWPDARLVPVPCLRLLALRHPVQKYHSAVRRKKDPAIPRPCNTFLAVTRRDYVIRRYQLTRLQHVLLSALLAGRSVREAIEATAAVASPRRGRLTDHLHTWFRNWTAEGFFQAVALPVS
jgi:hypothetical protein